MLDETKNQTPFPQFIDKNPKGHFHWSLFIVISVAIAAALSISIQNFKTAEEIDSMAPGPRKTEVDEPNQHMLYLMDQNRSKVCIGDVNRDGAVDNLDLDIQKKFFGKVTGQSGYNDKADSDNNGIVNQLDINIVKNNFGCKNP